jgi:hypothetical protein
MAFPKTALQLSLAKDKTGVTPNWYRGTGEIADRVRLALGQDRLVFMTPDIGGASLCCERLRIVDLGMLANRDLARHGYGRLDSQLTQERPELIEAHEVWAEASALYSKPAFADYVPSIIDSTRLFVRKDVFAELLRTLEHEEVSSLSDPVFYGHRYVGHTLLEDDLLFARQHTITVFSTRPGGARS